MRRATPRRSCIWPSAAWGATFVPRFSAANELASGTLVELGSDMPAVRMETQMLWHARKWIAPHLAEFIQVTRRFFAS